MNGFLYGVTLQWKLDIRSKSLLVMIIFAIILLCMIGCGMKAELYTIIENDTTYSEIQDNFQEVTGTLEVHYIDVGQADATLIMNDGHNMLIDGGNSEDSSLIYAYLKEYSVDKLDYMICTHAHEDHVGGLAGALNYAKVETVYCPVKSYDTEVFSDFLKYLHRQEREITIPDAGTEFMLGNAKCTILGLDSEEKDPNNTSIVLKAEYGKTTFLFSGDAEQSVENIILDKGYDVSCTVLKVPHHGSDTSLSYRWLNAAMPEYGVISVGKDNTYGHPCEDTLSKLRDAGVTVFRTDLQGDIICKSDGQKVTFEIERNAEINTLEDSGSGQKNLYNTENYVLNENTKKFHRVSCTSVMQMKKENRKVATLSRGELIEQGYDPCGNCKP